MRKHITFFALAFLLVLPGLASAVYLDSVTGTADCNGWNTEVEITFRSGARMVRLEYTVVLLDGSGLEMERFEYAEPVDIPTQNTVVFSFDDVWTAVLPDGPYTMTCAVLLFDIYPDGQNRFEGGFTTGFECSGDSSGGEDPLVTDFCPRGSGFWKNHPADWPVMDLDLGADHLDQAALLVILDASPRGDATVILARPLITAKLNMAGGAGDGIAEVIAAADDFLTQHPVFSNPGKADRKTALAFMAELGAYNSGECSEGPDPEGDSFSPDAQKQPAVGFDKAAAVEVIPLGSLKALYR